MPVEYELPPGLSAEKIISRLTEKFDLRLIAKQYSLKTYYDSFDWRLWRGGLLCEFNRCQESSVLTLKKIKSGTTLAQNEISEAPVFPTDLKPGTLRDSLQSLLDMRALMAVLTLDYDAYQLNLYNRNEKIVLRIRLEDYEHCNARMILLPIKGYTHHAQNVADFLNRQLNLEASDKTLLQTALRLQGRKPGDYSGKIQLALNPEEKAEKALKAIFHQLLIMLKRNEPGVIADTDSEFLHDYRVSVRRIRSGLGQLKGVLPDDVTQHYIDFFAWLGQITCPTRDLDVYLLSFDRYKESLPPEMRDHLDPLRDFLLQKKLQAHRDMIHKLRLPRYRTTLLEWDELLTKKTPSCLSQTTIKELADRRILKLYLRLLNQGRAITDESPAEHLHTLRKTCKKIRYLMEFFHHFYPAQTFSQLLKPLKNLQHVLGDFQDFHIQEYAIKQYGEEMMTAGVPANTLMAMGILMQTMDEKKCSARQRFASSFKQFDRKKIHSLFHSTFIGKD